MNELQALIEKLQHQSGSNVVDLRYRASDTLPWAVSISWGGGYLAVVPDSTKQNPIESLNAALAYLEHQKSGKPVGSDPVKAKISTLKN
jgi:hypothetical protein